MDDSESSLVKNYPKYKKNGIYEQAMEMQDYEIIDEFLLVIIGRQGCLTVFDCL